MTEMMKTTKTTKQQDSGLEGGRGGGGSDTLDVKKQINPATSSPDAAFVVDAEIEAYLEKLQTRLHDVTICSDDDVAPQGGGGPCPVWWLQIEARWRLRFIAAEQLMILRHAKRFGGEFLPTSNRPIGKLAKHLAQLKPLVSLFDYWEPLFSCSDEERVPSDVLGDGPKWLCGPSQHRRLPDNGGSGNEAAAATEVRQPPCRVFSGGSNFDDGLERGMFDLAGCEAYIIDPTLMPGERLTAFEARLARYGAILNTSVGVGGAVDDSDVGSGGMPSRRYPMLQTRGGERPLVPLGDLLLDRWRRSPTTSEPSSPMIHVAVLKLDIEGAELGALQDLWRLCAAGALAVDQLTVEVHAAVESPLQLSDLHAMFASAPACGLMLHHKEVNTWGCRGIFCVEFSWVSQAHARRVMEATMVL